MKRLSTWDTYVQEALRGGDRSIELPLTEDESYIVGYPTRRQGREIAKAQREGDTDALLVAMLGDEAGNRVKELAEDWPAFVLDEFLIDVMRKFGMIPDEGGPSTADKSTDDSTDADATASNGDENTAPVKAPARRNGRTNGSAGKGTAARKSSTSSKR